jgi:hypothetical protein
MNKIKEYVALYKASAGCRRCGYNKNTKVLHFAHRNPEEKYRDKYGKVVEPADMIKGRYRSRYGIETIVLIVPAKILVIHLTMIKHMSKVG